MPVGLISLDPKSDIHLQCC